jgi:hypothetical protein
MRVTTSGETRLSLTLHEASSEELDFYRGFIERHGGQLVHLEAEEAGSYRMDFPVGATRCSTQDFALPLEASFQIVLPDGACITWFRELTIDGCKRSEMLLTSLEEEDMHYG